MDNHHLFSFPSLKMLVVLYATPAATPAETVRFERLFAKVVVIDFMRKLFASVHIIGGCGRTDTRSFDTGVLQWIDVDSQAEGMLREPPRTGYGAVVEARTVVGLHGGLVGGVEVVHQSDAVDGISLCEQGPKDAKQIMGNSLVANHLALLDTAFKIVMVECEITELVEADSRRLWHRLALHAGFHRLGNGLGEKDITFPTHGVLSMGKVGCHHFFIHRGCLRFGAFRFLCLALAIAVAGDHHAQNEQQQ